MLARIVAATLLVLAIGVGLAVPFGDRASGTQVAGRVTILGDGAKLA